MAEVTPSNRLKAPSDIESLSDSQLDVLERQIAAKYLKIVPWGAFVWGFGNCILFLSLIPLAIADILPLWLGFPLATVGVIACYLPSHEAQHSIVASRGKPLRWLNELLGHFSTIPMVAPFRILRATHMEHHAHCNDEALDPDYDVHAPSDWAYLINSLRRRFTESGNAYGETIQRIGQGHLALDGLIYQVVFYALMIGLAWSGYALEAFFLWWLPKHLGMMYISYYLSWAPHHPAEEQGRYRDTRGFKSRLGNILSMGMQYHIVHHLYPRIPLSLTPAAYRELKPILQRRNCDLGAL